MRRHVGVTLLSFSSPIMKKKTVSFSDTVFCYTLESLSYSFIKILETLFPFLAMYISPALGFAMRIPCKL